MVGLRIYQQPCILAVSVMTAMTVSTIILLTLRWREILNLDYYHDSNCSKLLQLPMDMKSWHQRVAFDVFILHHQSVSALYRVRQISSTGQSMK